MPPFQVGTYLLLKGHRDDLSPETEDDRRAAGGDPFAPSAGDGSLVAEQSARTPSISPPRQERPSRASELARANAPYPAIATVAPRARTRRPDNSVRGEWGPVNAPSSPGQTGSASDGEHAIQSAYASGKGYDFTVDPLVMRLEHAIDIGDQIQTSIDKGGSMRPVLEAALKKPTRSIEFSWPRKAFNDGPFTPAGRSVGRFSGNTIGTLTVDPSTRTWRVEGTITINPDFYDWKPDSHSLFAKAAILAGALTPNRKDNKLNFQGKQIQLRYNRAYKFETQGAY